MNCHPDRSVAKWRDPRLTRPASNTNGSVPLPFVIVSEAESLPGANSNGHLQFSPPDPAPQLDSPPIDAAVRMIVLPVEPIIFQGIDPLQTLSLHFSSSG